MGYEVPYPFFVFFYIRNILAIISYFFCFERNIIKNSELKMFVAPSIYIFTSNL